MWLSAQLYLFNSSELFSDTGGVHVWKGLSYSVREITKYNLLVFINKEDEKKPHP